MLRGMYWNVCACLNALFVHPRVSGQVGVGGFGSTVGLGNGIKE